VKALAPETPVSQVMTANPEWVKGQETIFCSHLANNSGSISPSAGKNKW
jgi:hypothetical protein